MKTMKKYQTGAAVKGSKGAKASQIIAGISAAAAGAAGIGKNISNRRKAKKAAQEKTKMEAEGKMQYGGNKKMKKPGPKSKPRPITIDEKYGILGDYGPKTESDTNMLNYIDNVGKAPIPRRQKGGSNVIQSIRRNMLNNKENRLIDKGIKNMKAGNVEKGRAQFEKSDDVGYKRRHLGDKYKTGGMVNANAKIAAAKKATGRVGGISSAPKTATPKAKMGGMMRMKKK
jgi:hypothetical protein